jgi:hypothetical protein
MSACMAAKHLYTLIRIASVLVPAPHRREWLAEWHGELSFIAQDGSTIVSGWSQGLCFCLGCFPDASSLRWEYLKSSLIKLTQRESWARCLGALVVLTLAAFLLSKLQFGFSRASYPDPYDMRADDSLPSLAIQLTMALIALPGITSLSLGEYPTRSADGRRIQASGFWWLFCMKALLIGVFSHLIGLCVSHTVDSVAILFQKESAYLAVRELAPIQFLITFASCLFGWAWVLRDQRQ